MPSGKEIVRNEDNHWIHLRGKPVDSERDFLNCRECDKLPLGPLNPEALRHHSNRELPGKYLFFDPNRESLLEFLRLMILKHGFNHGKVSAMPLPRGTDNVLCLYWRNGTREAEVVELARQHRLRYAAFKSDAETLAGQYSDMAIREGLNERLKDERDVRPTPRRHLK